MSFNINYFSQMAYGAGNALWYYNSSDNLASLIMGAINQGYFLNAYKNHKIPVKQGDVIIHNNAASKLVSFFSVYADFADTNASVVRIAGPHTMY